MTYEQQRTTISRDAGEATPPLGEQIGQNEQIVEQRATTVYRPSGSTLAARVVVVVFGIIQALLVVRIVLLALDARRGNDLVAAILSASQPLVGPFEGMFRSDAVSPAGSFIDIAAITALVALTIVEIVILAIVRVPQRNEAT
jgi:uncharacterized protein YggT (Ycf19 family)